MLLYGLERKSGQVTCVGILGVPKIRFESFGLFAERAVPRIRFGFLCFFGQSICVTLDERFHSCLHSNMFNHLFNIAKCSIRGVYIDRYHRIIVSVVLLQVVWLLKLVDDVLRQFADLFFQIGKSPSLFRSPCGCKHQGLFCSCK